MFFEILVSIIILIFKVKTLSISCNFEGCLKSKPRVFSRIIDFSQLSLKLLSLPIQRYARQKTCSRPSHSHDKLIQNEDESTRNEYSFVREDARQCRLNRHLSATENL